MPKPKNTLEFEKSELLLMLEKLVAVADACIPSDDCSNSQLAEADAVISASHAVIDKHKK
jgi:hypothetical protein